MLLLLQKKRQTMLLLQKKRQTMLLLQKQKKDTQNLKLRLFP